MFCLAGELHRDVSRLGIRCQATLLQERIGRSAKGSRSYVVMKIVSIFFDTTPSASIASKVTR